MAINLYRQAWDIPDGEALLTQAESTAAATDAEAALAAVQAENTQLAAAAEAARQALQSETDRAAAMTARAEAAEADRDSLAARIEDSPVSVSGEVLPVVASLGNAGPVSSDGRDYGRYFALVICN
jgi:membrane protein involved in colicin uptake